MSMRTHLSLQKEFDVPKQLYLHNYGWITTILYQEYLPNITLENAMFDELPEEIWEDEFELETLWLDENNPGDGNITIEDLIKLLEKCQTKHDRYSEEPWYQEDWTNITNMLKALIPKHFTKYEIIEFKFY